MSPLGKWIYYFFLSIPILIVLLMLLFVLTGIVLMGIGAYRQRKAKSFTGYFIWGSILAGIGTLTTLGFIALLLVG